MATQEGAHTDDTAKPLAPSLPIPPRAVTVVEHPSVIINVDKGIKSLGGAVALSKALRSTPEPNDEDIDNQVSDIKLPKPITASLTPDYPLANRLVSTATTTNNLLLKVTVPKRTGRKRLKGSTGPFLPPEAFPDEHDSLASKAAAAKSPYVEAETVFRSIKDNPDKYTVKPVGVIDEAHRFRTLPDLQFVPEDDKTMLDIGAHLLPLKYSELKKFKFNTEAGADLSRNIPPSPEYIQTPVQYDYKIRQNTFVKYTGDEREEVNIQKRTSFDGYHFVKVGAPMVPMAPKPHLAPEAALPLQTRNLIAAIRAELADRPVITRHILYNKLGWDKRDRIREAAVYCGYFFETGPWREALITFGYDPRRYPKNRHYQTIAFNSFLKTGTATSRHFWDKQVREMADLPTDKLRTQHKFDGINVSLTGSLFQFCDISDPMIRSILDTEDIRETCAPTFQGWYHVGTWAKATVILKDKMNRIIGGETPDNTLYERISTWPEFWDDADIYNKYRHETQNTEIHKEKAKEHLIMQMVRAAARSPRYAFERMEGKTAQPTLSTEEPDDADTMDIDAEGEYDDDVAQAVPEDVSEIPDGADALFEEAGTDSDEDNKDDDSNDDDELGEVSEDPDGDSEVDSVADSDLDDDDPIVPEPDPEGEGGIYSKPLPFGNPKPLSSGTSKPLPPGNSKPLPFGGLYK